MRNKKIIVKRELPLNPTLFADKVIPVVLSWSKELHVYISLTLKLSEFYLFPMRWTWISRRELIEFRVNCLILVMCITTLSTKKRGRTRVNCIQSGCGRDSMWLWWVWWSSFWLLVLNYCFIITILYSKTNAVSKTV